MAHSDDVRAFWDDRATKEERAGTRDLVAKELEMRTLAEYVEDGMTVCDWGCGNGMTALYLAERFNVRIMGYDYSEKMIEAARATVVAGPGSCRFVVADIREELDFGRRWDLVFTERMLVNLDNWEEQKRAILYLATLVKPGGKLLLMENSLTGLAEINRLREAVGLERILSPWHNEYLVDDMVKGLDVSGFRLIEMRQYSGAYYFLSRVVNAWQAAREGSEPEYDAAVNMLALELPPTELPCAQGKLWVYEKQGD